MKLKNNKSIKAGGTDKKVLVYVLAIVAFFLLLCLAIWWFFDYKIASITGAAGSAINTKTRKTIIHIS